MEDLVNSKKDLMETYLLVVAVVTVVVAVFTVTVSAATIASAWNGTTQAVHVAALETAGTIDHIAIKLSFVFKKHVIN
jgi:hypothetical protein